MITLTDYGRDLISAAMDGITQINFHSIKTTEETKITEPTDSYNYEGLGASKQTAYVSNVTWDRENDCVIVTATVSNKDLAAAYDINGIGLYANGTDVSRFPVKLFGYEYFASPDHMPLPTDEIVSYTYTIVIKIASAEQIDFTLVDGAYASAVDVQDLTNLVHTNEANKLVIRCNQTTASTEKSGFNYMQEVSVQGMTADHWVDGFVSGGTYNGLWAIESFADKLRLWFVTQPATNVYITAVYLKTYS